MSCVHFSDIRRTYASTTRSVGVAARNCNLGRCYSHLSAALRHAIHFARTLRSPSPRERKHQNRYSSVYSQSNKVTPNNKTEIPIRIRAVKLRPSLSAFVSESATMQMQPIPIRGLVIRPASEQIFRVITQREVVITFRRFGTTYRPHLQDKKLLGFLTPEGGTEWLSRNVGKELPLLAAQ